MSLELLHSDKLEKWLNFFDQNPNKDYNHLDYLSKQLGNLQNQFILVVVVPTTCVLLQTYILWPIQIVSDPLVYNLLH